MGQGAAIHQLQLAAQRHAMGDPRGDQALLIEQLGDVVRGRLALHCRVGRQDHFAETALLLDPRHQLRNADRLRPQAIERRQMPLQHEVTPAIARLLDRIDIHRPFHHAQLGIVAARVGALRAQLLLGQGPALAAMANAFHRLGQALRQAQAAAAVALEQLQGHTLGSFLTNARQNAQGVDQLADEGAEAHGKGLTVQ